MVTALLSGLQLASQSAFFLLIPRLALGGTAASLLLAYVFAGAAGQLTPFGAQFFLLKAVSQKDQPALARGRVLTLILIPLLGISLVGYWAAYSSGQKATPLWLMAALLSSFSARSLSSAVLQAANKYHWVQALSIGASLGRIVALSAPRGGGLFLVLAVAELSATAIWIIPAIRILGVDTSRMPTAADLTTTAKYWTSSVARVAATELDKLVFAGISRPEAFVAYALASKVFSGASAIVNAYFARETPAVVNAKDKLEVRRVAAGAWPMIVFAIAALILGAVAAAALNIAYARQLLIVAALLGLNLLIVPWYTPTLDYAFYNRSPVLRILIQSSGAAIVVGGTYLFGAALGAFAPALALLAGNAWTALVVGASSSWIFRE